MESKWISVKQMTKDYGISKSFAYKLIGEGKIPAQKLGGKRIIINKVQLDMLLNEKDR